MLTRGDAGTRQELLAFTFTSVRKIHRRSSRMRTVELGDRGLPSRIFVLERHCLEGTYLIDGGLRVTV